MDLALKLLKSCRKDADQENVFISPYSISSVMSMLLVGARNDSERQIVTELFGQKSADDVHQKKTAMDNLVNSAADVTLQIANKMCPEISYELLPEFQTTLTKLYQASVEPMDFIGNPDSSRISINDWVSNQTAGKIKDLLPGGSVTPATRLALINAVYFKGAWLEPFDGNNTYDTDFHVSSDVTTPVKMMSKDARFAVYMDDDMQAVELPYMGEALSMVIMLPNQRFGLSKLVDSLTEAKMATVLSSMQHEQVDLKVPKMKIEFQANLNEVLKSLGVVDIFDENKSDLSGISGKKELCVSCVAHKAFLEVNEEGSEAAAATAAIATFCMLPPCQIICDHPFLVMIKHKLTNMPLFVGVINSPGSC